MQERALLHVGHRRTGLPQDQLEHLLRRLGLRHLRRRLHRQGKTTHLQGRGQFSLLIKSLDSIYYKAYKANPLKIHDTVPTHFCFIFTARKQSKEN